MSILLFESLFYLLNVSGAFSECLSYPGAALLYALVPLKRHFNFGTLLFTNLGVRSHSQPYTAYYIEAHGQI